MKQPTFMPVISTRGKIATKAAEAVASAASEPSLDKTNSVQNKSHIIGRNYRLRTAMIP